MKKGTEICDALTLTQLYIRLSVWFKEDWKQYGRGDWQTDV